MRAFSTPADPQLDLELQYIIHASRDAVWRAWESSQLFARWWLPEPLQARIVQHELRPGGALLTLMSEDGQYFAPHMDALFLEAEQGRRIVLTNALDSTRRPTHPTPVAITAEFAFSDHHDGTLYEVRVRHASAEDRALHEQLGFFEGWGTVTATLAQVAESL